MLKNKLKYLSIILIICVSIFFLNKYYNQYLLKKGETQLSIIDRTWQNYHQSTRFASQEFNIDQSYLLALIALETSGFSKSGSRFENHVYQKLLAVKNKTLSNFETISYDDLKDANHDALKNLATSWGPFQLMGYQCLHLDVKLREIRGQQNIYYGTKWIRKSYGSYLNNKLFKDAFHIHNSGRPYPKWGPPRTHSLKYVPNGLKYMLKFQTLIEQNYH